MPSLVNKGKGWFLLTPSSPIPKKSASGGLNCYFATAFYCSFPHYKNGSVLKMKIFPQGQIHRDLLSCLKGMG